MGQSSSIAQQLSKNGGGTERHISGTGRRYRSVAWVVLVSTCTAPSPGC